MPISWPLTLPQYVDQSGYSDVPQDPTIRTPMEVGPAKVRARYSAVSEYFTIQLTLTSTETGYLDTFYKTTTAFGTSEFTWTHPRTSASVSMRFTSPPSYAPKKQDWTAKFTVEVLP